MTVKALLLPVSSSPPIGIGMNPSSQARCFGTCLKKQILFPWWQLEEKGRNFCSMPCHKPLVKILKKQQAAVQAHSNTAGASRPLDFAREGAREQQILDPEAFENKAKSQLVFLCLVTLCRLLPVPAKAKQRATSLLSSGILKLLPTQIHETLYCQRLCV